MAFFGLFGKPDVEKMRATGSINGLIKALGYEKDQNNRHTAIIALVEIGSPAVEQLCQALSNQDYSIRQAAAEALGLIRDDRAIRPLIVALEDSSIDVRIEAIKALGVIGDSAVVAPLWSRLEDTDARIRETAVEALETIGPPVIELLCLEITDAKKVESEAAAEVLVKISVQDIEPLGRALWNPELTSAAAKALEKIGDTRAVKQLCAPFGDDFKKKLYTAQVGAKWSIDFSDDNQSYVIWLNKKMIYICAAEALGNIGDPSAIESLRFAFRDADEDVGKTVIEALGKIQDPRTVEPLINKLGDGDRKVREAAIGALVKKGASVVEPLCKALSDTRYPSTVPSFFQAYDNGAIIEVLGRIGGTSAVEPLCDILRIDAPGEERRRIVAIDALGRIGDAGAVEPLCAILRSDAAREKERKAAADALGKIGDTRAVEPLCVFLRSDAAGEEERKAAAIALGVIADRRAASTLISALTDSTPEVQEAVNWALNRI